MAANKYIIDFNKFVTWLNLPRLRGLSTLALLKSLVYPINILYNDFIRYRTSVLYKTSITPQVCYLEKALNDTFDYEQRRITIIDTADYDVTLIHQDAAQIPLITHQDNSGKDDFIPIIHDDSAYADSGIDFIVNIPFAISDQNILRVKSILNTYKLASKRYKIYNT